MLGDLLYENKDSKTAQRYYKHALKHNPNEVRALICIGNAKYDKGVSILSRIRVIVV